GPWHAGARIEEGHPAAVAFAFQAKHQRIAGQPPAGVDGIAEDALAYYFKSPHRRAPRLEILYDESKLRLDDEQLDVRKVPRNGVLGRIAHLRAENPAPAIRPNGGRRRVRELGVSSLGGGPRILRQEVARSGGGDERRECA